MPRDVAGLVARSADGIQLKALLAPYPSEEMTCWPVSTRVGTSRTMNRASSSLSLARVRYGGSGGPEEAMNWQRWLAALLVMLALAACAQGGQVSYAPYPHNDEERMDGPPALRCSGPGPSGLA
jgi:hypothetical protein